MGPGGDGSGGGGDGKVAAVVGLAELERGMVVAAMGAGGGGEERRRREEARLGGGKHDRRRRWKRRTIEVRIYAMRWDVLGRRGASAPQSRRRTLTEIRRRARGRAAGNHAPAGGGSSGRMDSRGAGLNVRNWKGMRACCALWVLTQQAWLTFTNRCAGESGFGIGQLASRHEPMVNPFSAAK